ncbi:hypothetical protein COT42_02045 [Candidatus Saganbacteria bacterium CG08_land_8_20_14_0_20_45_16]|uniref:MobA-like NTP transferase domain-containing protein n=1 Tax=Candidatus Saganbacteria bacterium CG08_land_8_20_14_0_20_45_16 TaxID=2014293 RepID=A0A2H0Y0J9_UNCSA|nr:MAG: hypothetical protein COT42_02045 [Candidatus Saganbacteria bacterium CG08_land_8_20_14_0_20_45_16]
MNAIVLAGGKSSRFGSDKAFAKLGDSTIAESLFFPLSLLFKKIGSSWKRVGKNGSIKAGNYC